MKIASEGGQKADHDGRSDVVLGRSDGYIIGLQTTMPRKWGQNDGEERTTGYFLGPLIQSASLHFAPSGQHKYDMASNAQGGVPSEATGGVSSETCGTNVPGSFQGMATLCH
jgi:hypothetical protein